MKKLFCLAAVLTLMFCGCKESEAELTPPVLGKAEGKYMYKPSEVINPEITNNDYKEVKNVSIGGGGYVIGIIIHPKNPDLMYIRTDVGGMYRWEADKKAWKQLLNSMPSGDHFGVDGMAIDPQNENILFACLGTQGKGGVYKSSDKGETWKKVLDAWYYGNTHGKEVGEPVMVDPVNSDIVYCGTRQQGMFISNDGGETWGKSEVEGNVRSIVFDKNTAKGGKSQTVYVSVFDKGLFRSTDGGKTWVKYENAPEEPRVLRIGGDGTVLLTGDRSLYRVKGMNVIDITPTECKFDRPRGIAIDPENSNRIAFTGDTGGMGMFHMPIFYTTDGGKTWTNIASGKKNGTVPWWPDYYFSADTCALTFGKNGSFYFTDWYGTWMTENVDAGKNIEWTNLEKGHEEMVTFGAITTPSEKQRVILAQADNGLLRFKNDVDRYPDIREGNGQFLDYFVSDPDFIVCAGGTNNSGKQGGVWYFDKGNWKSCKGWNADLVAHDVAISSESKEIMVVNACSTVPYYTDNMGKTWHPSTGAPVSPITSYWSGNKQVASDRVYGNIFYYMAGDGFYRSEDYGKTYEKVSAVPTGAGEVITRDGAAGDIWVSCELGILHSVDYGANWTYLPGTSGYISIGKGPKDGTYALWVLGELPGGKRAVYYSVDEGKTFVCVTDNSKYSFVKSGTIFADVKYFGRVYIGSGGCGWMYIDLE